MTLRKAPSPLYPPWGSAASDHGDRLTLQWGGVGGCCDGCGQGLTPRLPNPLQAWASRKRSVGRSDLKPPRARGQAAQTPGTRGFLSSAPLAARRGRPQLRPSVPWPLAPRRSRALQPASPTRQPPAAGEESTLLSFNSPQPQVLSEMWRLR